MNATVLTGEDIDALVRAAFRRGRDEAAKTYDATIADAQDRLVAMRAKVADAFEAGAAEMRERAAESCQDMPWPSSKKPADYAARVRALPLTAPSAGVPVDETPAEPSADFRLALEAWAWLAGTHPCAGGRTAAERVAKAETCLSTAVDWEGSEYDKATRFASAVLLADDAGRKELSSDGLPPLAGDESGGNVDNPSEQDSTK